MYFVYFSFVLFSCDNPRFDKDKRQIIAKDEIFNKNPGTTSFEITSFKEDTLQISPDSAFKHPIRYSLGFIYKDSAKVWQTKRGTVIFTPDGNSIINSFITDSIQ
ncbi:MAG: hypothetical protein WKF59_23020 [Chitinophagaceae bacterium]